MTWTKLHARLCAQAFTRVLGKPEPGTIAFVRCLTADVVERLARDEAFAPAGWQVWRVADTKDSTTRTITADRAVELRESKGDAALLLVDTALAGAGMDGIYSAAQEVQEVDLFDEAGRLAANEITRALSRESRQRAERALKKARGFGGRISVSHWTEFDFLARIAAEQRNPGEVLYLIGLWPAKAEPTVDWSRVLDLSRVFVERLVGTAVGGLTLGQRIENLKLLNPSNEQLLDLERFLRLAGTKPVLVALQELAKTPHLWVNALQMEGAAQVIQRIELVPWRTNTGKIAKWSGLLEDDDAEQPPVLILKPDAERTGEYSKLEVRWKAHPGNLERGAVTYRIVIMTDMEEELAAREVSHLGKREEKCRFTNDDFSMLSDDALISTEPSIWMSPRDAATYLGVGVDTIYDACAAGGLKHVKLGYRTIRLRRDWIDRWAEERARQFA